MEKILRYFPRLTDVQRRQFELLQPLYEDWNAKINVISRKDIANLYEHHVLHSLALAKAFISLTPGTRILDVGTGGGFPGVPLAILFPECEFTMIDGTGKKIMVVNEVIKGIGLRNAQAFHRRGEEEQGKYDFIVSRAVMPLPDLHRIVRKNIAKEQRNAMANGICVLKGGNIDGEIHQFRRTAETTHIAQWFGEEWFKGKHVIYLPC